jgi:spermine synthase
VHTWLKNPVGLLSLSLGSMKKVFSQAVGTNGRLAVFVGLTGATATLRTYLERNNVTVTIEYDVKFFNGTAPIDYDGIKELEQELANKFFEGKKKTKALPQVKRDLEFDIYFTTSDDRLMEYDIKEMVFDQTTEFQHIQIAKSANYGNILVLDDLVNLAESDLRYTEGLMCRGKVDYTGKDVLILGGGDGALLYELRKENAHSITMIEIDDVVMKACKEHLRSVCDDTLDNYKTKNYEVIVGDCIPFMEKCKADGKKFDFIFGDLTDIPISQEPQGQIWNFIKKILVLSFSILKKDGTYFTHANGISAQESLEMFKKVIGESADSPVETKTTYAFVPSFQEKWVFFQVQRK